MPDIEPACVEDRGAFALQYLFAGKGAAVHAEVATGHFNDEIFEIGWHSHYLLLHPSVAPPLTLSTWPEINPACREARKATASATSDISATLPSGIVLIRGVAIFGGACEAARNSGVFTAVGDTTLKVTPVDPNSRARAPAK